MENQIVQNVELQLVELLVIRACLIQKLPEMMFVDTRALRMGTGKKEFIRGFIGILR